MFLPSILYSSESGMNLLSSLQQLRLKMYSYKVCFVILPGNLSQHIENGKEVYDYPASVYSDSQCSDLDLENDSDEAFLSDDSDSQLTHEDQKKSKWFRDFFEALESMSEVQVTEHDRQWHCPACKGGPGAIDWFRGLGPLATHARTMRSRRVKMHRSFADVLNEELRIRRTGGGGAGVSGTFGKWKGLQEDNEAELVMVVWPPIVVIQNTQLEQDEEEKVCFSVSIYDQLNLFISM